MLVLSVYTGNCIYIQTPDGKTIEVMLTQTKPGQAKLGFNAPSDYIISRNYKIYKDNDRKHFLKQEKSNCA